jgi:hypothetical protein
MKRKRCEGFIVSAELVLIMTVLVMGTLVGWLTTNGVVQSGLLDLGAAMGSIDQSYSYGGTEAARDDGRDDGGTSATSGSGCSAPLAPFPHPRLRM